LENKLSHIASRLLLSSIKSIEDKNYKLTPQDEVKISFAPKLKKQDGLINWESPACEIENLVRGCLNWPGAFTYYNGKLLKIYKAKVFPLRTIVGASPGEIIEITKDGILVATGKDVFSIEELQLEGKRIMTAEEFIAGHKIKAGEILKRI
jgi:methionyl-tRNA formyltransferase